MASPSDANLDLRAVMAPEARYYPAPFGPALCAALEKVALGGQSAPETVLSSFGRPRVSPFGKSMRAGTNLAYWVR